MMNTIQSRNHPPLKSAARSAGFTLLEVLIAVLVVAIGLAALANLQGKLTRYSAMAKQRTLAMNIAEQQIETMYSFNTMGDTGASACSTSAVGFDDLTTCDTATTVTAGNMTFNLTWTVTPYVQNADGSTDLFTASSTALRPDLKRVTVKVTWTDGQGSTQDVEMNDVIDATSAFNSGRVMAKVDSNTPPKIPFDSADFPGVVEIAIGNDKLKGSTTPEPEIKNHGTNVETTFDVVTFLQSGSDAYLQRREEFKVLNCICTLDAGTGTGREPTVWDGEVYDLGAEVTKRTGSVSANESGQPSACDTCCRDHHDAESATLPYDPFRPDFTGDAGTFEFHGDHAHYNIVNGQKVLATEGDDYLEACRFIRKDGLFRLTTDMSLQNLDVMAESYPTNYNDTYSTAVVDFVDAFASDIDTSVYPGTVPSGTYTLDAPGFYIASASAIREAMSRGIYVDYMKPDLLYKIKCLQDGGTGGYADYCDTSKDSPWKEIMPFYDVDLTSLANWNSNSLTLEVSNSPISDIDQTSFSRGEITVAQDHFDVETTVDAGIEESNTGLTETNPVDPDDENEKSSDLPVTLVIGGTPPSAGILIQGYIYAGSNQINVETVRVKQTSPTVACELYAEASGNTTLKTYQCDMETVSGSATGTVTISDYNAKKVTGSSTTIVNRKVCYSGASVASATVYDDGLYAYPDLGIKGERTVLSFSGLTADVTVNITIVSNSTTCP